MVSRWRLKFYRWIIRIHDEIHRLEARRELDYWSVPNETRGGIEYESPSVHYISENRFN